MHNRAHELTLITALFCICAAGPALAWAADNAPRQQTVQYSDLNLETPAGNAALYRRIRTAAQSVCDENNSRQIREVFRARTCLQTALKQAVLAINNPALTKRYLAAQRPQGSLIAQASH